MAITSQPQGQEALQEGAEGGAGGEGLHPFAVDPQQGAQRTGKAGARSRRRLGTARSGSGQRGDPFQPAQALVAGEVSAGGSEGGRVRGALGKR